jgi:hypothetical protein
MPASYRAYFDQSSFNPGTLSTVSRNNNPRALPNANGRPRSPGFDLSRQEWRRYVQQLAQLPPTQIRPEEVSIVAPRHGSPLRLNNFIARMEQSLSSDSSWIDEAPTPPASPPPPPRTIVLGSPNVSQLIDQANGFATSAPKRRKVEIGREDSGPHIPSCSRPVLTVYDTLVRMVQDGVYARAQDVDRANGFAPPPPQRQYSAIEGTAPRPHVSNHRHPSPPLPAHPPAQPSYLTRANLLPWFSAQGIDLRPEEAQVLDAFLAQRYESTPLEPAPGFTPPRILITPPTTPPLIRAPSPERVQITIASMLAERENPLLEPLRSQLFMLEQAGLGDMEFDGGVATELMGVCPFWS